MKVLLVDDHAFMHLGLRQYLSIAERTGEFGTIEVVGSVSTGAEALAQVAETDPDLVLLDVSLPDVSGIEVARRIRSGNSAVKLVFVSMHEEGSYVRQGLEVGANGYLSKRSEPEEFLRALRAVFAGRSHIADVILMGPSGVSPQSPMPSLTKRQRDVLKAVSEGLSIEQTAACLGISRKTVEYHRGKIMRQCALKNTVDVYRYAVAHVAGQGRQLQAL